MDRGFRTPKRQGAEQLCNDANHAGSAVVVKRSHLLVHVSVPLTAGSFIMWCLVEALLRQLPCMQ